MCTCLVRQHGGATEVAPQDVVNQLLDHVERLTVTPHWHLLTFTENTCSSVQVLQAQGRCAAPVRIWQDVSHFAQLHKRDERCSDVYTCFFFACTMNDALMFFACSFFFVLSTTCLSFFMSSLYDKFSAHSNSRIFACSVDRPYW